MLTLKYIMSFLMSNYYVFELYSSLSNYHMSFLIKEKKECLLSIQRQYDKFSNISCAGEIRRRRHVSPNGLNILCQYFCFCEREKARTSESGLDSTRSLTRVTDKSRFTANCIESRWMLMSQGRKTEERTKGENKIG